MVSTEMFKDLVADCRKYQIRIETESAGCLSWHVFLVFCANKEERRIRITLQNVEHNIKHRKYYCPWLESTGSEAELIVTRHIGLIEEFYAISMVDVSFNPNNIGVFRLNRLKPILHRVFQQIVGTRTVIHLKNERIAFIYHITGSYMGIRLLSRSSRVIRTGSGDAS